MESILIQVAIVAAIYALQQFLLGKNKKKGPYHYPDEFPTGSIDNMPIVVDQSYEELHYEGKYKRADIPVSQLRAQTEQKNKIAIVEKIPNAWNGKLSNKHMIHGFVMAELFAPPRSLNPYKIKKY